MLLRKSFVIAALVAVLFPALASAEEDFIGRWWRMPATASTITLTEAEKLKLDQLYQSNRQNLIDMKAALDKERLILEYIMDKEPLIEATATEQFRKVEKRRAVLSEERFRYFLEVRKVLGTERFQKLTAMVKKQWRGRRAGREAQR